MHTHIHTHAIESRDSLELIHHRTCFWEVGGKQKSERNPTQTQGEHAKVYTDRTADRTSEPEASPRHITSNSTHLELQL